VAYLLARWECGGGAAWKVVLCMTDVVPITVAGLSK